MGVNMISAVEFWDGYKVVLGRESLVVCLRSHRTRTENKKLEHPCEYPMAVGISIIPLGGKSA